MARAGRTAQRDGLAHGAEHRPRALEVGRGAADHDASEPSTARFDAARHRRVEQRQARGREIARELLGVDRIGRAHVDHQRAGARPSPAASRPSSSACRTTLPSGSMVISASAPCGRGLGRRRRQRRRMGADEIRHRLLREVEHAQLEARAGEPRGHRPAHHAEADEGDGGGRGERGHGVSFVREIVFIERQRAAGNGVRRRVAQRSARPCVRRTARRWDRRGSACAAHRDDAPARPPPRTARGRRRDRCAGGSTNSQAELAVGLDPRHADTRPLRRSATSTRPAAMSASLTVSDAWLRRMKASS